MNKTSSRLVLFSLLCLVGISLAYSKLSASSKPKNTYENKTTGASSEIIELHDYNTVTLRTVVSEDSVAAVMSELRAKSARLTNNEVIYLVLDTPGGSVAAGNHLVSFIRALPQKVKTVTIFAASMGFHTVQRLDERLILESGTLMSHRASLSGLSGEVPGELLTQLNYITSILTQMDKEVSKRMGLDLKEYQEMIRDEYWVYGSDAVEANAADRVVVAKCGLGMDGSVEETVNTFFGAVRVSRAKCPLIPGMSVVGQADAKATNYVSLMIQNKAAFVRTYIKNNKWTDFQRK